MTPNKKGLKNIYFLGADMNVNIFQLINSATTLSYGWSMKTCMERIKINAHRHIPPTLWTVMVTSKHWALNSLQCCKVPGNMNTETLQILKDKLNYNLGEDLNSNKTQHKRYNKCYIKLFTDEKCSGVALWKQISWFNWQFVAGPHKCFSFLISEQPNRAWALWHRRSKENCIADICKHIL